MRRFLLTLVLTAFALPPIIFAIDIEPAHADHGPSSQRIRYCHIQFDRCSNHCGWYCRDHRTINGHVDGNCTQELVATTQANCIAQCKQSWLVDCYLTP